MTDVPLDCEYHRSAVAFDGLSLTAFKHVRVLGIDDAFNLYRMNVNAPAHETFITA